MDPNPEDILNAVKKSGYLFEQEVATIFENLGINIRTNAAFKDADEEKSREIDILGFKIYHSDNEKKIRVTARFICECKNNNNPFVFITRNKSLGDGHYIPPNFQFPKKEYEVPIPNERNSYRIYNGFEYFKLKDIFPYSLQSNKAIQFCKIFPRGKEWLAQHDGIYDSIFYPLVKSVEHYKKNDSDFVKKTKWNHFSVYFPIVILNSKLYSIDTNIDNEVLNPVEHITFIREVENSKLKDAYLIDFVEKQFIENYFSKVIEPFMKEFTNRIISNVV